jgi:probable phosphoglycerate mutase
MSILLIRHGETASNAARVVQTPDTPLSLRGLEQARRLGRRLAREGVERILSSDYARARMTADAVRDATGAPLDVEPLLRERNFGDLRGRAYADIGFDIFAEGYQPPNGESWESFHARVARAWSAMQRAALEAEGRIAVVTHGLVCFSVLSLQLGGAEQVSRSFSNTSLTVIDSRPPWAVRLVNCSTHLDQFTAADEHGISGL